MSEASIPERTVEQTLWTALRIAEQHCTDIADLCDIQRAMDALKRSEVRNRNRMSGNISRFISPSEKTQTVLVIPEDAPHE